MDISPKMLEVLGNMKRSRGVGANIDKSTQKALLRRGLIKLYAPGRCEADGRRGFGSVAPAIYEITEDGLACL